MSRKFNYKTERYNHFALLIFVLIMGVLEVGFFSAMFVIPCINKTGDWFTYTFIIIIQVIIIKVIIYPFVVYSSSSLYDIKLYKDRFEIKREIKNVTIKRTKTIYYKDIVSLTELSPILGMYVNNKIEDTVLEIKLKNKKIYMLC